MKHKYVFGPVPSRRLGRSLGVDLLCRSTCTFNCIYCQVGRTGNLTQEVAEYVPADEVLRELEQVLLTKVAADYITISGSGEPTLHSRLGEIIERIRGMTAIPIAVITNGSLLWREDIRKRLMRAHVVIPSLDAGTEETFRKINRPHEEITFEKVVEGQITFRQEYKGHIFLEVFLIPGVNDTPEELGAITKIIKRIRPDRVDLNTAVRPTAEKDVPAMTPERLKEIVRQLGQGAKLIADFKSTRESAEIPHEIESVILNTVQRRPVTAKDLATTTGLREEVLAKYLERLTDAGTIGKEERGEEEFYKGFRD